MPGEIKHGSLRREPQVAAIPNTELKYAHIVSDGVLTRKFSQDIRAMVPSPFLSLSLLFYFLLFLFVLSPSYLFVVHLSIFFLNFFLCWIVFESSSLFVMKQKLMM